MSDDELKYINDITLSMRFTEDTVVIPATEVVNMARATKMYQEQMAQLRTLDWINGNIELIKDCSDRDFVMCILN